ncbi:MAG: 4-alpha-glucanotransferase [Clostridium sp.]|nr:4-alpha-glucanotransferase [Prevotella sp.]MCM1428656.1 4-alpha-glucanotransferase [Clostridium sp.]
MKIRFHINYHTNWGETLHLSGSIPSLGGGDISETKEMTLTGPDTWELEVSLPATVRSFTYTFIVKAPGREWRFEWGEPHRFEAGQGIGFYNIFDSWQDMPTDKPFYSSAFTEGMLNRRFRDRELDPQPGTANLRLWAPLVGPDEVVAICGEGEWLGNWNPDNAVALNDAHYPEWEINIPLNEVHIPFQYKFIIVDKESLKIGKTKVKAWENIDNRIFGIQPTRGDEQIVVEGLRLHTPFGNWKGAGTAVPVFSLRSNDDFGVGDFMDLKRLVDWAVATNQKIVQLLPVNDTTKLRDWTDSYPYSANSAFALHPMYLRLQNAGILSKPDRRAHYDNLGRELNELTQIDYERVTAAKEEYMHELYAEHGKATSALDSYKEFVKGNERWLKGYAAWSVLRDLNGTPDNDKWESLSRYDASEVDKFLKEHSEEAGYYYYVQYHLDRQLREARDYAHLHGVVLKGDIPIGIGRYSADAWENRHLFNMDSQAGAPPDDFSINGQNWGFPTYNWEEMAKNGFQWWKTRFIKMADYFDAYRIDHILGFFRIWQIPLDAVHGLLGYFNPALPYSAEELRNSYDFWIDPETQTRPLVLEWMLTDFFGYATETAKSRYLESDGYGRYRLKEELNTQAKIERHFAVLDQTDENVRIKNGLLGLLDDVLFIEDPAIRGHYHPRITAQYTYQYRCLNDYEKYNFNRLYNDFFYHRHNDFWEGKAMWKLPPLIDSTKMLCCAEDLGMIPDCVPDVMHRQEILALEIQRMPKDPKVEFGDTWTYPYYSVCTTSTHDMPGIRAWWETDHELSQRYFNNVLHEGGAAPYFAEPWICEKIVRMHLESPSMLCILPIQDWLSQDGVLRREKPQEEQINEPANPCHYWRYRMHLTIEDLLNAEDFNSRLREEIVTSGR